MVRTTGVIPKRPQNALKWAPDSDPPSGAKRQSGSNEHWHQAEHTARRGQAGTRLRKARETLARDGQNEESSTVVPAAAHVATRGDVPEVPGADPAWEGAALRVAVLDVGMPGAPNMGGKRHRIAARHASGPSSDFSNQHPM